MKIKLEYIWLDGYTPEPNIRSKVKVIQYESAANSNPLSPISMTQDILDQAPEWNFDGSSTMQADGKFSDCILKPVRIYTNPLGTGFSFLVFCEVLLPDRTPHPSNTRAKILEEDEKVWFGFEQEYVLRWFNKNNNSPLGFENFNPPEKQGKYYCSVGHPYNTGREISDEHLDACLSCGIGITGTNSEVMLGQWEYQVFGKGLKKSSDDLWISRFLLFRIAEKYKISVDLHPKTMGTSEDWNGSGLHTNFSNYEMRETGGKNLFDSIFDTLKNSHKEAISIYGSNNNLRLTGQHETQNIDMFTWGISDRGASIRIPLETSREWKGYLEDRRPGSNGDPYKITEYLGRELKKATQKAFGEG